MLSKEGFRRLLHLSGDMSGWREAGHPVEVPVDPREQLAKSAAAIFGVLPAAAEKSENPESEAKTELTHSWAMSSTRSAPTVPL